MSPARCRTLHEAALDWAMQSLPRVLLQATLIKEVLASVQHCNEQQ